jgi:hypothetical protein
MTGVYTVGRSVEVEGLFRASEREEDRRRKGRGGETARRGEKHVAQATRASRRYGWLYIYRAFHPQHPPHLLCFTVLCCYVALCIEKVQRRLDDVSHPSDLPAPESTGFRRASSEGAGGKGAGGGGHLPVSSSN